MGIEDMPLQCMYCPRVLAAKRNAEGMQALADRDGADFDFLDHCDPVKDAETFDALVAVKFSLHLDAAGIWSSYHTVADTYNRLSRTRPCPGVNMVLGVCGLERP